MNSIKNGKTIFGLLSFIPKKHYSVLNPSIEFGIPIDTCTSGPDLWSFLVSWFWLGKLDKKKVSLKY